MVPRLKVLWATRNGLQDWEVDYVREMLKDIPHDMIPLTNLQQIVPNALIVINHSIPYLAYLSQYESIGIPFGVFHLSDEWFDDNRHFYTFEQCKFVFRNYYHECFDVFSKMNYLPLSFKIGFWSGYEGPSPRDISWDQRPYVWSFAGAPRTTERMQTIKLFEERFKPALLHYELGNSFSSPETGISTETYRKMLLESKFGVCPVGISKTLSGETGRVTEVLEAGCIPVVLRGTNSRGESYWFSLYGEEPPYIIGDTWEECAEKVAALMTNQDACEALRKECFDFWYRFKTKFSTKVNLLCQQHLLK